MLRPGGSLLSLRAISRSQINLTNQISSNEQIDEKFLLLMPSSANRVEPSSHLNTDLSVSNRRFLASTSNLNHKIHDNTNQKSLSLSHSNINVISVVNNHITSDQNEFVDVSNDKNNMNRNESKLESETQIYFKRWIILAVFCFISGLNAFNWIEYSIIQDVVIVFYNQSLPSDEAAKFDAVNWFSMVYMLCYIPLVFPAMFLLDRKGLKLSCILGALLTAIGACLKCAAVRPDLFGVAMAAQTICAIAQAFTLGIPARLSALWFGPTEIATATSIGVFGNQLGSAIGFLIPPSVVQKSESIAFMQKRFYFLLVPVAAACVISFVLALIFVKDKPEKPPSIAQLEIRNSYENQEQSDFKLFKQSLKNLFKNINFILILISYGISTGCYYSIGTLLNQILSQYYTNENEKIGLIGLILVVSGLVGAVIGGIILDKTKAFKLTTLVIYACSFCAMVLFTFTLNINIWIVFGTSFLLGFFMTGYLPVGFELAAEVTYPESEGTSCGLLNTSAQIFGIAYTYAQSRITTSYGSLVGNIFVSASLLVGTIITAFVRSDLRRQKALQTIVEDLNEHQHEKNPIQESNKNTPQIKIDDFDRNDSRSAILN